MKALVLAAGKGTRLKGLTADIPKPMLPVGDKPLLDRIVAWLRKHGVQEIAINLHHAPEKIRDYFGDGVAHDVAITYSYEKELLGTAGAAKKLASFFDDTFVIVYGDVFTNLDLSRLAAFHETQRLKAGVESILSMALYRVPNPTECGLVDLGTDGRIASFLEKPPADQIFTDLANTGIAICDPDLLDLVPAGQFFDFAHDLFPLLLAQDIPLFGQAISADEFVIDIGTVSGYQKAQQVQCAGNELDRAPVRVVRA